MQWHWPVSSQFWLILPTLLHSQAKGTKDYKLRWTFNFLFLSQLQRYITQTHTKHFNLNSNFLKSQVTKISESSFPFIKNTDHNASKNIPGFLVRKRHWNREKFSLIGWNFLKIFRARKLIKKNFTRKWKYSNYKWKNSIKQKQLWEINFFKVKFLLSALIIIYFAKCVT